MEFRYRITQWGRAMHAIVGLEIVRATSVRLAAFRLRHVRGA